MRIIAKPLDTLFFRDGKPFSMGDESWADGVFPPYPSVIYGALRSWFISNHPDEITDNLIDNISAKIKINSIYYDYLGALHFPMPLDMVEKKRKRKDDEAERQERNREEREKTYEVTKLKLKQKQTITNYGLPEMLYETEAVENVENGLIDIDDLEMYLGGTLNNTKIKKIKDIVLSEAKVGIGRDKRTNGTLEGNLYRVGMRRTENLRIIIDFDLPASNFRKAHFIKMGGEGKVVSFEEDKEDDQFHDIDKNTIYLKNNKEFKLYLATPAIFKNGWKPNLEQFGIRADLVAAAVGKPLNIGGFDIKKRKPKYMLKAVPAGSVYYYRTTENPETILKELQGKLISDEINRIDTKKEGYGLTFVGNF